MHKDSLFPTTATAYGTVAAPIRAAAGDPITSHEAAAKVSRSAKAALHRAIVLGLIHTNPGSTGAELWSLASAEQRAELETPNEIWRKANDLRHAGLVTQGEPRACKIKGSRMVVWNSAP